MTGTTTPRIYVADLAAYNAGRLHGVWIDATADVEDMLEEVRIMLDASPEPASGEFAIHEVDAFDGVRIDEFLNLETVREIALFIEEHGRLGAAMIDYCDNDIDEARRLIDDGCYVGAWEDVADYAEDLIEQTVEIPDAIAMYVDYGALARDMELNGEIFTFRVDHEVHVFLNA